MVKKTWECATTQGGEISGRQGQTSEAARTGIAKSQAAVRDNGGGQVGKGEVSWDRSLKLGKESASVAKLRLSEKGDRKSRDLKVVGKEGWWITFLP